MRLTNRRVANKGGHDDCARLFGKNPWRRRAHVKVELRRIMMPREAKNRDKGDELESVCSWNTRTRFPRVSLSGEKWIQT